MKRACDFLRRRVFQKKEGSMHCYFYQIAGKTIQISSEIAFDEDSNSRLFYEQSDVSPDLFVHVTSGGAIPAVRGTPFYQEEHFQLFYTAGSYVIQALGGAENLPVGCARFQEASCHIEVQLCPDLFSEHTKMQQLWRMINLPFQLLLRGVITLHSSSVQTDSGVILFCGRSGIGKSTQAALWHQHEGAQIYNGDRNAIAFDHGHPTAYGLPFCGTSGICHRFSAPIRAIVSLQQAPDNHILRLRGTQALLTVANNTIGLYYNLRSAATMDFLLHAATQIPIYQLSCTPDVRAVHLLKSTLEGACAP